MVLTHLFEPWTIMSSYQMIDRGWASEQGTSLGFEILVRRAWESKSFHFRLGLLNWDDLVLYEVIACSTLIISLCMTGKNETTQTAHRGKQRE